MSDIKLQVGEDYLNKFEEIKHIESYSNVDNYFRDVQGLRYKDDGSFVLNANTSWTLYKHIPKVNKGLSDGHIENAFLHYYEFKTKDNLHNIRKIDVARGSWKAAIEWYKQQIK